MYGFPYPNLQLNSEVPGSPDGNSAEQNQGCVQYPQSHPHALKIYPQLSRLNLYPLSAPYSRMW